MNSFSTWKCATLLGAFVVLHAALAAAQDKSERKTPRMDVFVGFSASHDHAPSTSSTNPGVVTPGWLYGFDGGFAANLSRSLDVVMEVGLLGGRRTASVSGASADSATTREFAQTSFLLGGPQITMRRDHLLQPFARGLAGYSCRHVTPNKGNAGFAAGVGGGLDLALSPRLAIRIIQYDFLAHTGPNGWTDYHRVSFGVVFRFPGDLTSR